MRSVPPWQPCWPMSQCWQMVQLQQQVVARGPSRLVRSTTCTPWQSEENDLTCINLTVHGYAWVCKHTMTQQTQAAVKLNVPPLWLRRTSCGYMRRCGTSLLQTP